VIGATEEIIHFEKQRLGAAQPVGYGIHCYLSVIENAQDYRIDSRKILSNAEGLIDNID
jgi:hypothetical protein